MSLSPLRGYLNDARLFPGAYAPGFMLPPLRGYRRNPVAVTTGASAQTANLQTAFRSFRINVNSHTSYTVFETTHE